MLTNLTTLNCNENITEFGLSPLLNLVNLGLCAQPNITDQFLENLVHLTTLDLSSNNEITNNGLSLLTNLIALNLTDNELIMDSVFVFLPNITTLFIRNSKISDDFIHFLPDLTCLDISRKITTKSTKKLTNLTMLRISPYLTVKPKVVRNLTKLSVLCCNSKSRFPRPRRPRGSGGGSTMLPSFIWKSQSIAEEFRDINISEYEWDQLMPFPFSQRISSF